MDILGLVIEFIFLAIAVYLYLFSSGRLKSKNPELQAKADRFRKENGRWLRILSLALMAIMLVNIVIHISQMLPK